MSPAPVYLVLFHIVKEINIGHLVRSANAFNASVVIVGRKDWSRLGAVGRTRRTTSWEHFYSMEEAMEALRQRNCRVIGVEIADDATSIWDARFAGPTAFLIGNEGEGLTPKQLSYCDELVYIPQYGSAVSLNVNVATSIVLHHYARQADFEECSIDGSKFRAVSRPAAGNSPQASNLDKRNS